VDAVEEKEPQPAGELGTTAQLADADGEWVANRTYGDG
jgi:hypothetical protein